jgi:hypothetical protein
MLSRARASAQLDPSPVPTGCTTPVGLSTTDPLRTVPPPCQDGKLKHHMEWNQNRQVKRINQIVNSFFPLSFPLTALMEWRGSDATAASVLE